MKKINKKTTTRIQSNIVCFSNRLFLNGKIEEKYFTERINSNKRGKILCEKPTVGKNSSTTHFVFCPSVFVRKRQMTHPGSESSKVIALQNETVGVIEEQLLIINKGCVTLWPCHLH